MNPDLRERIADTLNGGYVLGYLNPENPREIAEKMADDVLALMDEGEPLEVRVCPVCGQECHYQRAEKVWTCGDDTHAGMELWRVVRRERIA